MKRVRKKHTTTNQAIEMRDKMNAKFVILTHFSQRYAKLPLKTEKCDDRTGVAFDFLKVNPNSLKKTAFFKDILEVLYKDDLDYYQVSIERKIKKKHFNQKVCRRTSNGNESEIYLIIKED